MRWFRFYDDALNDPKVQRLSPHLFRAWVNLLCLASKSGGHLPSIADIAFNLRMSENDAKSAIEDLILAGLVDVFPDGRMEPHNWSNRQFASDNSKDRTRKWRKKKEKASCDVTVTAYDEKSDGIESESDTETDTDYVSSSESIPREEQEQSFDLSFGRTGSGKKGRGQEKLVQRAIGFGVDAAKLIDVMNRQPRVANRSAYFTTLFANEIARKLPGISTELVRDALWDKGAAAGQLYELLMHAEAA